MLKFVSLRKRCHLLLPAEYLVICRSHAKKLARSRAQSAIKASFLPPLHSQSTDPVTAISSYAKFLREFAKFISFLISVLKQTRQVNPFIFPSTQVVRGNSSLHFIYFSTPS